MCDLLEAPDAKIIKVAMEGLEQILKLYDEHKTANGENQAAVLIEECSGLDKLERLQQHENSDIYNKAVVLLIAYFGAEGEDVEDIAPQNVDGQYVFGIDNSATSQGGFNFDGSMQQ